MDSPLISPAKARQAAIQAKDWAYINSWLSRKYAPNSVPPFERNEDTLKALLAIAAANDAADEEAALVHRAREEVIQALKERDAAELPQKKEILDALEAQLDAKGEESVNDLADMTAVLGSASTNTIDLAHAIMELTRDEFDAARQVQKVEALQTYLNKELETLQKEVRALRSDPAYTAPAELSSQTMEWVRSARLLGSKINEYRDRIASLQRSVNTDGSTIPKLVAEEEKVFEIQETVEHLGQSIKAFYDLPPNLEEAKNEYKRLQRELDNLTQERDKLFEKTISQK